MSCLPCSSLCQWSLCSGLSMLCESERRRTLVPPRPLPDTLNRKQEARQESAGVLSSIILISVRRRSRRRRQFLLYRLSYRLFHLLFHFFRQLLHVFSFANYFKRQ